MEVFEFHRNLHFCFLMKEAVLENLSAYIFEITDKASSNFTNEVFLANLINV